MARQIIELGYRGRGPRLTRKEFETRKRRDAGVLPEVRKTGIVVSQGKRYVGNPLLEALAEREAANRDGYLMVCQLDHTV